MIFLTEQTIKIRKWPLYFMAAIFLSFVIFIGSKFTFDDTVVWIISVGLLIFIIAYWILCRNSIHIKNEGITFVYFLVGEKTIYWNQITSARIRFHYHGHGGTLLWELFCNQHRLQSFSPTFYSRRDLLAIAQAMTDKCPTAKFDQKVRNIAEGKFPWYIF